MELLQCFNSFMTYCNDEQNLNRIKKSLISAGADTNSKDQNECLLIHGLCQKERENILEFLEDKSS